MHSREGVKQWDPLEMIAYGIGPLPLIKNLKMELPDTTQPWYKDKTRVLGTFKIIEACFHSLELKTPVRGYYTELSRRVLIVHHENI